MIRLAIVVEGETEEEFVNNLLTPHLHTYGVSATPHPLGGNVTVERLASEMVNYFWSYDRVTSLVDFYGFRNKGEVSREDLQAQILKQVDAGIKVSWDQSRVIPYVQQYEFEALLFSKVAVFEELRDSPSNLVQKLEAIRTNVSTPEDINDGKDTHPSRRIAELIPSYQKRVIGPYLAELIGLSVIRSACPRFGRWIDSLESLQQRNALA
ncbi:MAG: DUF4276 family protein [Spirochaetaceae bacterium]|nr:DUF4276 family protein [Spirochaetaceae bacterium]